MFRLALVIAAVVVVLDQVSKVWLLGVMEANAYLPIEVTGFFNLVMVWNEGVSFGMLDVGSDMMRWILMAFALAVAVALLIWARRAGGTVLTVGIGLIAGGAVGNALDRLFYPVTPRSTWRGVHGGASRRSEQHFRVQPSKGVGDAHTGCNQALRAGGVLR
ncbi:MAG: signal peptidase II [Pseudomonadota bacterium]